MFGGVGVGDGGTVCCPIKFKETRENEKEKKVKTTYLPALPFFPLLAIYLNHNIFFFFF